jgi:hypothetical protein
MATKPSGGAALEARVQRLFLAQGSFAERGLVPTATSDHRMLATDIDVLVSEYVSGFHVTKRHIECKTGKYQLLDRILWLRGVRAMLGADSSYLIAVDIDLDAEAFARSLQVGIFSIAQLEAWEASAGVAEDIWPCRSDYTVFDPARQLWNRRATEKDADEEWRWLRQGLQFVEIEGWMEMRYRHLNKALRLVEELARRYPDLKPDADKGHAARYLFSALLVRLAQYCMGVCADVLPIPRTDRGSYLARRLIFGDQDPKQAAGLISTSLEWAKRALAARGIDLPEEIDLARVQAPPAYAKEFAALTEEILSHSTEARYLVLATERAQFGRQWDEKVPRLRAAAQNGSHLTALLRGFVIRALSIPNGLADAVHDDLAKAYGPSQPKQRTLPTASAPP